jgi:hypothetical protein
MKPLKHLLSICLLASVVSATPVTISAQEAASSPEVSPNDSPVQITLRPKDGLDGDRFEVEMEPGSTSDLVAVIQSFGPDPIELRTYTTDVAPMVNGGLGVRELDSEQHEPTTWMTYKTETMTLDTNQMIEKPFTVTVPEDTAPGEYVNALVLETVNPVPTEGSDAFNQYFRKVVSVYITVPGPVEPAFELGEPSIEVQGSEGLIYVPLHNTGNVRIDLEGVVKLVNGSGDTVLESPVILGPVYSGQETVVRLYLPSMPPEGDYRISMDLSDEELGVTKSLEEAALLVPEAESSEVAPIAFDGVVVEANADPIQFANVTIDVAISGSAFQSTRLTMSVFKDGEAVEDFVLADNLSLPLGTTTVQQRYLPLTGWESGSYTFSLKLEDTSSGGATEVFSEADVATIEVP